MCVLIISIATYTSPYLSPNLNTHHPHHHPHTTIHTPPSHHYPHTTTPTPSLTHDYSDVITPPIITPSPPTQTHTGALVTALARTCGIVTGVLLSLLLSIIIWPRSASVQAVWGMLYCAVVVVVVVVVGMCVCVHLCVCSLCVFPIPTSSPLYSLNQTHTPHSPTIRAPHTHQPYAHPTLTNHTLTNHSPIISSPITHQSYPHQSHTRHSNALTEIKSALDALVKLNDICWTTQAIYKQELLNNMIATAPLQPNAPYVVVVSGGGGDWWWCFMTYYSEGW